MDVLFSSRTIPDLISKSGHLCRSCPSFRPFGFDSKSDQFYGMCLYWNFSINDTDGNRSSCLFHNNNSEL